jgi:hypothetical protein
LLFKTLQFDDENSNDALTMDTTDSPATAVGQAGDEANNPAV